MESQRYRGRSRQWATEHGHSKEFHEWFEARVRNQQVSEDIKWLSRGPNYIAKRFKGYVINGFGFLIYDRGLGKRTQNYGVAVTASTSSFASNRDQNPIIGDVTYYGVVKEIIELDYYGFQSFVLFQCDWFQSTLDEFRLPMVNRMKLIYRNDPFVLASQVRQVFYVQDSTQQDLYNVINAIPRDYSESYSQSSTSDMNIDCVGD